MSANTVVNGTQDVGDAGLVMWWRGKPIPIPPVNSFTNGTEVTRFVLRTTDVLLNALGGYSSSSMSASTLYYVYMNPDGVVKASATAPTYSWYGVRVLGLNAAARDWLFIGYAYTNASTEFDDDQVNRNICNWYNRIRKSILLRPGYVNDDSNTAYTVSSTVFAAVNAGTDATGSYISTGEDSVAFFVKYYALPGASATIRCGLGDNSTTSATVAGMSEAAAASNDTSVPFVFTPAEGRRTVTLLAARVTANGTMRADMSRLGSDTDPATTYLTGEVVT
jgi:hypothetical protein